METLQLLSMARLPQRESGSQDQYHAGCSSNCINISHQCLLTSGVREVPSFLPAVWASAGAFLIFIQTGFAVDPPTACHLVWGGRYMKADLTDQFVWRWIHKLAVISIGSHLSHLSENIMYISLKLLDTYLEYFCHKSQLEVFREDIPCVQLLHNTRISKHLWYAVYIILHRVSML